MFDGIHGYSKQCDNDIAPLCMVQVLADQSSRTRTRGKKEYDHYSGSLGTYVQSNNNCGLEYFPVFKSVSHRAVKALGGNVSRNIIITSEFVIRFDTNSPALKGVRTAQREILVAVYTHILKRIRELSGTRLHLFPLGLRVDASHPKQVSQARRSNKEVILPNSIIARLQRAMEEFGKTFLRAKRQCTVGAV